MNKILATIRSRKITLKMIRWYTLMMKAIFDTVIKVMSNPMYMFDVSFVLFWMPRFNFILRAILSFFKLFSRLFGSSVRIRDANARVVNRIAIN